MRDIYTTQDIHMKIFMSDVSAYNTHPDLRPDIRRKKCVLYAENYGIFDHKFTTYPANYNE